MSLPDPFRRRPRPMYWILRNRVPVPTRNVIEWGEAFNRFEDRVVAKTTIEQPDADSVEVSTVFIGLDHRFFGDGPPLLFESMVFGGPLDGEQFRYPTWDAAAAGHALLVDEAVLEGKVASWEVRERLGALSTRSKAAANVAREQITALLARVKS